MPSRRRAQARTGAIRGGRQRFPWFAWLVLATMLVIGAALGHAATDPTTPLPPKHNKGFKPTSPKTTPGQTLVPPPQHGSGGVIAPPATVDQGIAHPTPPAQAFPTPVIKPPGG